MVESKEGLEMKQMSPNFCPLPDREGIFLPSLISKGTGSKAHLSKCVSLGQHSVNK